MTKDELVLITMALFFAAMLMIAIRAVLMSERAMDVDTSDAGEDAPSVTRKDPAKTGDAPAGAPRTGGEGVRIWTTDDAGMLRPISYPVPTMPETAPDAPRERETRSGEARYSGGPPSVVSVGPFIY